jgi:methylglutaconyl-CoA hydratase
MSVRLPRTLGLESMAVLSETLLREPGVWAFRGADAESFCAGLDLEAVDAESVGEGVETFSVVLSEIADGRVPSVALVEGLAQGGGVGIAAACDVVVATENARFCLPEMLFGLVPGAIWPVLRRRVSEAALVRWAKTARTFGADEAHRLGLVDEVVPVDDGERQLRAYRRMLGRPSAHAHARMQALCRSTRTFDLASQIREAAGGTVAALLENDVVAARRRFVEGGVPWEG